MAAASLEAPVHQSHVEGSGLQQRVESEVELLQPRVELAQQLVATS